MYIVYNCEEVDKFSYRSSEIVLKRFG